MSMPPQLARKEGGVIANGENSFRGALKTNPPPVTTFMPPACRMPDCVTLTLACASSKSRPQIRPALGLRSRLPSPQSISAAHSYCQISISLFPSLLLLSTLQGITARSLCLVAVEARSAAISKAAAWVLRTKVIASAAPVATSLAFVKSF